MEEGAITQLPIETVNLIASSQIVTSVWTTVKELVENSIDAGGLTIQIRLENYGLDLIEVRDNGWGITCDNVQKMFLPGCTSKIRNFEDIDKLYSYGFRGEALAAICKIAKVSVTTKTNADALAMTYDIDSNGVPVSSKPSHFTNGTVITVSNLFSNLPVRRLFLSTKKKMAEELKKTEMVVQLLSVVHPELNVSLIHNKCMVWKKNSVKGLKQSFMQAVTLKTVSKMDQISKSMNEVTLDMIVPKMNLTSGDDVFSNSADSIYLYVNKRPIQCKKLSKSVQEHIFHHYSKLNISFKYAVCLISINVPPQLVDINIEPNKTKVLLKNQDDVIKLIDDTLSNYYGHVNFHCEALKGSNLEVEEANTFEESSMVMEQSGEDSIHQLKKPRLEQKKFKTVSIRQYLKKPSDTNMNWNIEIIDEEMSKNDLSLSNKEVDKPFDICSQINKQNCVLTTPDEVSELNAMLNEKHHSVISTNSKNSITRLMERDELQCATAGTEKKFLPECPVRSVNTTAKVAYETAETDVKTSTEHTTLNPSKFLSSIDEKQKIVREIATGTENDAEESNTEKTNLSNMLVKSSKAEPEVQKTLIENSIESNQNSKAVSPSSEADPETVDDAVTETEKRIRDLIEKIAPNESIWDLIAKTVPEDFDRLYGNEDGEPMSQKRQCFRGYLKIMKPILLSRFPRITDEDAKKSLFVQFSDLYSRQKSLMLKFAMPNHTNESNEKTENATENAKNIIEAVKRKNLLSRPPRAEVTLATSLPKIKAMVEALKTRTSDKQEPKHKYRLLGRLRPENWLYVRGNEIGVVRLDCMLEVVTYNRLLRTHTLERKRLDKAILVDESILGSVLWTVLISLDVEEDPSMHPSRFVVVSEVIEKNGFRIELEKNCGVYTCGHVTEVSSSIPHFGIPDLKDILMLFLDNGLNRGLASWRPFSVKNYLINEAIRRDENPINSDWSELEELMDNYSTFLGKTPAYCLHNMPIFYVIHYIQN